MQPREARHAGTVWELLEILFLKMALVRTLAGAWLKLLPVYYYLNARIYGHIIVINTSRTH